MTKNQALMGLKRLKKGQRQIDALRTLVDNTGDALDREDKEYTDMQEALELCARNAQQAIALMERYAEHKTRNT